MVCANHTPHLPCTYILISHTSTHAVLSAYEFWLTMKETEDLQPIMIKQI
jgi:hypothetical protein